ncbi:hypothetical protein Tco_0463150 [Tanacetum coccineum]
MHGIAGGMPYHVSETSWKRETPGNVRKRLGNVPGKSGNVSLIGVASLPADQDSTNTTENVPHRKLWLSMAAVVSRM